MLHSGITQPEHAVQRQRKPKKPIAKNSPAGPAISILADAKISAGVLLETDENGEATLDLTMEAESGSAHRYIEIEYCGRPGEELKSMKLNAAHAAHLPHLYAALMARSPLLNPIVAVK
jgi:hypothetical protein